MVDAVILLIVAALLVFAAIGAVKHFRGEGPCCGGGSGKTGNSKKKKLGGTVTGSYTIKISGMHCQNCAASVTNSLNEIAGVTAQVDLRDSCAKVSFDRLVDKNALLHAVEKAGYKVISIS